MLFREAPRAVLSTKNGKSPMNRLANVPTRVRRVSLAFMIAFGFGAAFATFSPRADAVHDASLFELDGNAVDSGAQGEDWSAIFAGTSTANAFSFTTDVWNATNDNIFTGGSTKDDLDTTGWLCKQGGAVDKNDLEHAFASSYIDADGHTIIYFGADKFSTSGDAQIGFWFFLNPIGCSPGPSGSTSFSAGHTVGDILLLSDFTNGGNVSNIRAFRWVGTGGTVNGTLQPIVGTFKDCADPTITPNDDGCARVNPLGSETAPWPYIPKANLGGSGVFPKGAFYEGGIDLTALLGGQNVPCFGTFMAETRQSQSVDSTLEDFALGNLNTCPNVNITKTPDNGKVYVNDSFDWTLTAGNTGVSATNVIVTDTVPAGLTINSVTASQGTCGVPVGQAISCNLGTLAKGATATVTINVTATASVLPPGTSATCATVNNSGSVTADREPAGLAGDNTDQGSVAVCRLATAKTAAASLTRTHNWEITKTGSPDLTMYQGDTGSATWKVEANSTGTTDSLHGIAGTITIVAPVSAPNNRTVQALDAYTGGGTVAFGQCTVAGLDTGPVANPYADLDAGETLTCPYSITGTSTNGDNKGTARLTNVGVGGPTDFDSANVPVNFANATVTHVNQSVTISDPTVPVLGGTATAGTPYSQSAQVNYSCNGDAGTKSNTATITETGQTASASIVVTCKQLTTTKTARASLTRTHNWTITKEGSPDLTMYKGDTGSVTWKVDATSTPTDSLHRITGDITIVAPAGAPSNRTVQALDAYSGGGTPVIGQCTIAGGDTGNVANPYLDLDAGETLTCPYSITGTSTNGVNKGTARLTNVGVAGPTDFESADVLVNFTNATVTHVNQTVSITDPTLPALAGTASAGIPYSKSAQASYSCNGDVGTKSNTATITETGQTASDSIVVTCKELTTTKTATPSFTRTWTWNVAKTSDPAPVVLAVGETFLLPYRVTYTAAKADSAHKVSGVITIVAPSGAPDNRTVQALDAYTGGGSVTFGQCTVSGVDTGDVANPYEDLDAGETLRCPYTLTTAANGNNTGTARLTNVGTANPAVTLFNSATVPVAFGAPTTEIDESITVSDNVPVGQVCSGLNLPISGCTAGTPSTTGIPLGNILATQAPKTFAYTRIIGPFTSAQCGDQTITNTADLLTVDTNTAKQSIVSFVVPVRCPNGCTLTQGYWKTHSIVGPAPFDMGWNRIEQAPYAPGDADGTKEAQLEKFFYSGQNWYQAFWTPPAGGNAYYQLAHQYQAAVLNVLNGADQSAVTATLDAALALLNNPANTPATIGKLKGSDPKRAEWVRLAGILGSYNTGEIGPGHCSEDRTISPSP